MIPDSTAIVGILSGISTLLVRQVSADIDDTEVRAAVVRTVVEMNTAFAELQEEFLALQRENGRLNELLRVRGMQIRADGTLWDGEEGPFCPGCAADGKRAYVSRNASSGFWVCNACERIPVGSSRPSNHPSWDEPHGRSSFTGY